MNKIEIDYDSLPWWAKPFLAGALLVQDSEELKRYAELAGTDGLNFDESRCNEE